jgi:hypothetical protein
MRRLDFVIFAAGIKYIHFRIKIDLKAELRDTGRKREFFWSDSFSSFNSELLLW